MSTRTYGVEIEGFNVPARTLADTLTEAGIPCHYEGYNHITRNHWKVVGDSSIQGYNSFELVSPPLQGENGFEQIRKVCAVLDDLNAKVNRSCGLHVHLNARDLSLKAIKNICKIYYSEEKGIDAWMAPSRRRGQWCQSLHDLTPVYADFYGVIDNANTDSIRRLQAFLNTRYRKVNLMSYDRHGTVEFRQHQGTMNADKIINWVRFLQLLVEKAKTARPRPRNAETHLSQAEEVNRVLDYICKDHEDLKAFFKGRVAEFNAANSHRVTR